MRICILGPPGSGKGTIAHEIHARYGTSTVEVGSMLREEAQRKNPFGERLAAIMEKGDLIPDDTVLELVYKRVALCKNGFISDGFPRTVNEAEMFDLFLNEHKLDLDAVLYLAVDDEKSIHRIMGRLVCSNCKHIYHEDIKPPKISGICNICGKALVHRKDDTPETIKHRIEVYHQETEPVLSYYENQDKLIRIDGNKSIKEAAEEVFHKISSFVKP